MKTISLILILNVFVASALADHHARPELMITVTRISEEFANINTSVSDTTLAEYGITHGDTFAARFRDRTVEPFLGRDYKDVPRGDWVALIEEDHRLQIAISYGHAATELGCAVGDTLYISTKPKAPEETERHEDQ